MTCDIRLCPAQRDLEVFSKSLHPSRGLSTGHGLVGSQFLHFSSLVPATISKGGIWPQNQSFPFNSYQALFVLFPVRGVVGGPDTAPALRESAVLSRGFDTYINSS